MMVTHRRRFGGRQGEISIGPEHEVHLLIHNGGVAGKLAQR